MTRLLLVLAHWRSGTMYTAHLLQSMGLDIGHEKPGKHGVCGGRWVTPWLAGKDWRGSFKVIHVVRNPLAVVASVSETEFSDKRHPELDGGAWLREFVPIPTDPLEGAIASVVWFNRMFECCTGTRLQVEELRRDLPGVLGRAKIPCGRPAEIPTDLNRRDREKLSWAMLKERASSLSFSCLDNLANDYGYPCPSKGCDLEAAV